MIEICLDERSEELINAIIEVAPSTGIGGEELESTELWSYEDEMFAHGLLKRLPPRPNPSVVIRNALTAYRTLISYEGKARAGSWPIITADTASRAIEIYERLPDKYKNATMAALFKTDTTIESVINYCNNCLSTETDTANQEKDEDEQKEDISSAASQHEKMMEKSGFYRDMSKRAHELGQKWKELNDPDDCLTWNATRKAIEEAFNMYNSFLDKEKEKRLQEIDCEYMIADVSRVITDMDFKSNINVTFGPCSTAGTPVKLGKVRITTDSSDMTVIDDIYNTNEASVKYDITLNPEKIALYILENTQAKEKTPYYREMEIRTVICKQIQQRMTELYEREGDIHNAMHMFNMKWRNENA